MIIKKWWPRIVGYYNIKFLIQAFIVRNHKYNNLFLLDQYLYNNLLRFFILIFKVQNDLNQLLLTFYDNCFFMIWSRYQDFCFRIDKIDIKLSVWIEGKRQKSNLSIIFKFEPITINHL